jgi:hypothetical protein
MAKQLVIDTSALRAVDPNRSPLDVGYVDVRPTREEVVQAVREGRERDYGLDRHDGRDAPP